MIQITNVSKVYNLNKANEFLALNNISLEINDGDYLAIVGKSGSGKTTLINLISSISKPTSGKIIIDGRDIALFDNKGLADFRNKVLSVVYQDYFLIEELSVLDNIMLPLNFSRMKTKEKLIKCNEVLTKLKIKSKIRNKVKDLSGGEKQRVAIARALIVKPKYIVADEPTGSLDTSNSENIMEIFDELNNEGITLIIVTHNNEIANRCKRKIILDDGIIIE